jgi:hypothetical protein
VYTVAVRIRTYPKKIKKKNYSFREGYDGPVQKKVTFQPSGTVVVSTETTKLN